MLEKQLIGGVMIDWAKISQYRERQRKIYAAGGDGDRQRL